MQICFLCSIVEIGDSRSAAEKGKDRFQAGGDFFAVPWSTFSTAVDKIFSLRKFSFNYKKLLKACLKEIFGFPKIKSSNVSTFIVFGAFWDNFRRWEIRNFVAILSSIVSSLFQLPWNLKIIRDLYMKKLILWAEVCEVI